VPHPDESDPPRRRANRRVGLGTWDVDKPPVLGVVGRGTGRVRLRVGRHAGETELIPAVRSAAPAGASAYTDEWPGYARLSWDGYGHATVCHSRREWARDDDGDGVREVHCNTMEGIWTGLRNFLRPFRGVSKWYLAGYVALFEWAHNEKRATPRLLRALLDPRRRTILRT
jgi:transposase